MEKKETQRALRADILRLFVLVGCAVVVFLFTRAVAARQRRLEIRAAAQWYEIGESQLRSGAIERATESLRKATRNDPDNRQYLMRLADALGEGGHNAEARQALSRLRESDPEDAAVNLHLARLASKDVDVADAVRYYENALYGRWAGGQVDERQRQTRMELIRFLLDHHDRDRALSELLILDGELPDTATAHDEAAELFLKANDEPRALKDFVEAVHLDPQDLTALTGAGETAFQLGEYRVARHYLEAAVKYGEKSRQAMQTLSLVQLVVANDPLDPHISAEERQRRTLAVFDRSLHRLENCLNEQHDASPELESLRKEASAVQSKLHSKVLAQNHGMTRTLLDLVYRIESSTNATCGGARLPDKALLLIAQQHNGVAQ
jgi:tetratricopeptide (TPR) repeat protein